MIGVQKTKEKPDETNMQTSALTKNVLLHVDLNQVPPQTTHNIYATRD